jgi:hypothetical protein
MKFLIVGDVFGKVGRDILKEQLLKLNKNHEFDMVIVNGENVSHGKSITLKHYELFME